MLHVLLKEIGWIKVYFPLFVYSSHSFSPLYKLELLQVYKNTELSVLLSKYKQDIGTAHLSALCWTELIPGQHCTDIKIMFSVPYSSGKQ